MFEVGQEKEDNDSDCEMAQVTVCPMNGGSGLHSYAKNSTHQKHMIEATHELITKAVEKLDLRIFLLSNTFRIADLGCSTGPNTFLAVQSIIDSLEHKFNVFEGNYTIKDSEVPIIPEFQVFFNDLATNDFNQLFISLPPERKYIAAAVPGSFHGPLFPKDSLHFVHSSSSLHWLSRVPEEVTDKRSPAWNKGRVYYSNSMDDVAKAYEGQFRKDMDSFLKFRAEEVVDGELMALSVYDRPTGSSHFEPFLIKVFQVVEHALIDMTKEGKVSEDKLDTFNIPMYLASPEEVESAVKHNGCFTIESMENINVVFPIPEPKDMASPFRAILEKMTKQHFDDDITEELFGTVLPKKLLDFTAFFKSFQLFTMFVVLKRAKNYD